MAFPVHKRSDPDFPADKGDLIVFVDQVSQSLVASTLSREFLMTGLNFVFNSGVVVFDRYCVAASLFPLTI